MQRIPTATDAIFIMQGMSVGKLSLTKQTKEKTGGRRSGAAPGGSEGGAAQPPTQAEKEAEDKLMVTLQVTPGTWQKCHRGFVQPCGSASP